MQIIFESMQVNLSYLHSRYYLISNLDSFIFCAYSKVCPTLTEDSIVSWNLRLEGLCVVSCRGVYSGMISMYIIGTSVGDFSSNSDIISKGNKL